MSLKDIFTKTMYNDPGHGWLEIFKSELDRLHIADKISGFSYHFGTKVFLEEDCDAQIYIKACDKIGIEIKVNHEYEDNESWIRSCASYEQPAPARKITESDTYKAIL